MKGLLLKDFYTLWATLKVMIILFAVCAFVPFTSSYAMPVLVMAVMPTTALGLDEKVKWQRIQAMMPYKKRDIILSKYVLGIISVVSMTIISIVAQFIVNALLGNPFSMDAAYILLTIMAAGILMQAIVMPVIFRFGAEKARIFLSLAVGIFTGLFVFMATFMSSDEAPFQLTGGIMAIIIPAAVVLYFLSIFVSTKVYRVRR